MSLHLLDQCQTVETNQTARDAASDLVLHCLIWPSCPNTYIREKTIDVYVLCLHGYIGFGDNACHFISLLLMRSNM